MLISKNSWVICVDKNCASQSPRWSSRLVRHSASNSSRNPESSRRIRASWYGIWAKSAKRRTTRARMVRIAVGALRKDASTTHLADRSRCRPCANASRPSVLVVARRVRWPPTRLLSGHIPSMVVNGVPPGRSSLAECRTTMMDRPESVFLKRIWNGQIERRRFLGLAPLNEPIQRLGF